MEHPFGLGVVAEVERDDFQQCFTGMSNKDNLSVVVVAIRMTLLLLKYFSGRSCPLLAGVTRSPHVDN